MCAGAETPPDKFLAEKREVLTRRRLRVHGVLYTRVVLPASSRNMRATAFMVPSFPSALFAEDIPIVIEYSFP